MRIDFSQYSYFKVFSSFRARAASFSLPTVVRQRSRKCIKIANQRPCHPFKLFLHLIDVKLRGRRPDDEASPLWEGNTKTEANGLCLHLNPCLFDVKNVLVKKFNHIQEGITTQNYTNFRSSFELRVLRSSENQARGMLSSRASCVPDGLFSITRFSTWSFASPLESEWWDVFSTFSNM